ncbi:MAG: hypothetical protein MUC29_14950 [Pyrinomonadaceae bacterium]|nr:hypothetical protein [Pyrinomonadaceae bacterium]
MKKIVLSVLVAFLVICIYLTISIIYVVTTDFKLEAGSLIDIPFRLPKLIFYYFSPPNSEDFSQGLSTRKLIVGLITFFGNLLIYSIPIYVILSLFQKKKSQSNPFEKPHYKT